MNYPMFRISFDKCVDFIVFFYQEWWLNQQRWGLPNGNVYRTGKTGECGWKMGKWSANTVVSCCQMLDNKKRCACVYQILVGYLDRGRVPYPTENAFCFFPVKTDWLVWWKRVTFEASVYIWAIQKWVDDGWCWPISWAIDLLALCWPWWGIATDQTVDIVNCSDTVMKYHEVI